MINFWGKLNKPIYALAPMAGVTDSAFRQICRQFGADVVYSEMASATALTYSPEKTLTMLSFFSNEQPYVIQLFGYESSHFARAAELISRGGIPAWFLNQKKDENKVDEDKIRKVNIIRPAGIDINFGCPVKKVRKQGAGAALMDNLKQAREIIKAVIASTDLPVSIKCRAAAGQIDVLRFLDKLSGLDIKAVMIHGRTLAQGFSGPINTEIIKKARSVFGGVILANGDVTGYEQASRILAETEADGIGIARGALGRPWIFKAVRTGQSVERSQRAVFKVALKHAQLAARLKGELGIIEMRKHLCWYMNGLPGARALREKAVQVKNLSDIRGIFRKEPIDS
jgi:tRNA-dihydrouridine synthase